MKKIVLFSVGIFAAAVTLSIKDIAHAQITPQSVTKNIGTTFKNAMANGKESAAKNSLLRNQLVAVQASDLQNKEKTLIDELNLNLANLENIQTRIAAKTAEEEASGTNVDNVNAWIATSSSDIIISQNNIALFSSSTIDISATSTEQIGIAHARKLADAAINSVNTAHDDLQSALDALTSDL